MTEDQEKKEKPKIALIKQKKGPGELPENNAKTEPSEKKKVVVVKKKVVVIKKTDKQTKDNANEPIKEPSRVSKKSDVKTVDAAEKKQVREKPDTSSVASPKKEKPKDFDASKKEAIKQKEERIASSVESQSRYYRAKQHSDSSRTDNNQNTGRTTYHQRNSSQYSGSGGNYSKFNSQPSGGPGSPRGRYGSPQQGAPGQYNRFGQQGQGQDRGGMRKPGAPAQFRGKAPSRFPDKDRPFRPAGGAPRSGAEEISGDAVAGKPASKKFFKAKKKTSYQKTKKEQIIEKNFQVKKKAIQKTNPVPKEIDIMEVITVSELAKKMNLKASDLISRFMGMGMMVTINQQIDAETAEIIASEYNCKVNIVSLYDETLVECDRGDDSDIIERPPIVTVMGHVDHGKTKLLDAIRTTDIAASEHGGITQHIGAYKVSVNGRSIVFLDTPGHEAFTLMRARGAQVTDIVVLVVAANDGVMPQTVEAINHAKEAGVPIIVAVNKIDLPEANPDRVKQQLSTYDLIPEDWGGNTIFCEISALKKLGIENLLENILLQADVLELKANPNCRAEGKVIESKVDHGRGIVSSVLIERGTLNVGDAFIAGVYSGKVRAIFNDRGEKIESAPPATPVEILGFTGMPNAGDPFQVTDSEKTARQIGDKRQELEKIGAAKNVKKVTLDNLYDSISEGSIQELKVIIKGDVQGSVEALKIALEKLSTSEIRLNVIHSSAGAIVENDVNLASASNAVIVGFHVRPTAKAQILAEQEKVDIRKYNIIYDAVEDIKTAMEGLLAPELKEESIGTAEVRDIFKVPKIGTVAGCYITSGKVKRNSIVHLFRDGIEIHSGKIVSLKRFKDDVKEVEKNYECGIGIENCNDIQTGDIIEAYEIKEVFKKLEG